MRPTVDDATLEDALSEFLQEHPDATIDDIVKHVLTLRERDQLSETELAWMAHVERQGLIEGLRNRLRRVRTASARAFVSAMDDRGRHTWIRLVDALQRQDPDELQRIENHAWSVIREGVGLIQSQRAVLLKIGRPVEVVDARIRSLFAQQGEATPE